MTTARFETVVIERLGDRYQVSQGGRLLLSIPGPLFESYEAAQEVFPPRWRPLTPARPVRRLFWNPDSREFLMAGIESHPARTTEAFGSTPYRSFLHALWLPGPPVLLTRPFWNPTDPYQPFDEPTRKKSLETQLRFARILANLRPPEGWSVVLNATDAYLQALGVDEEGSQPDPDSIREISLAPPQSLGDPRIAEMLERLGVEHVGSLFPRVQTETLVGVHALTLHAVHGAEALFLEQGIAYQEGPLLPH